MTFILKAKHWQLFLVFIIPQVVVNIVHNQTSQYLEALSKIVNLGMILSWIWAVGVTLSLDHKLSKNLILFKAAFIWLLIYLPYSSFHNISIRVSDITKDWLIREWLIWVPHLIFTVAIVYSLGFCARVIKSIELAIRPSLSQYFFDGILIFLFPIGMWFLQPRVNRIIESDNGTVPESM
jgi:hypothetical protein